MAFVKGVWRILVAIKDGLVLLFLLGFFGLLYAALSWSPKPARSVSSGALLLKLDGTIVEQPAEIDPFSLLTGSGQETKEYRLSDIVTALEAAKSDGKVKAVVLNLDGFLGGGQVALSRVGRALDAVRAANKPVFAFATIYSDDSYQLAAHASETWVDPLGGVAILGRGGSGLYYKGLIDKLGVNTHVYRVGTYKSFVEPFIRSDQSPEARQANQALADALWPRRRKARALLIGSATKRPSASAWRKWPANQRTSARATSPASICPPMPRRTARPIMVRSASSQ